MIAHSIAERTDTAIVCQCGAIIPAVNTLRAQDRAFWRHADQAREEES